MIQKVYRGWRSRREMVIKRRAIRLIQAHGKRWRPWRRFQRVKRAIALIQRVWRGYRVRRMVRLLQEQIRAENRRRQMATLNESLASMELAVSRISEREAVKIQRAWRRHAERGRRERALRAALTIQAHWRGTRAARARRLLAHEMASIVDAVVDAAAARGEEYFDRLHRSARVIQNYVRRVRRWKLEKDAATRIQEAARAFIERRRREDVRRPLGQEEAELPQQARCFRALLRALLSATRGKGFFAVLYFALVPVRPTVNSGYVVGLCELIG